MKLTDKVALVTGGGSGIGRGAAIALAREGAKVAVMGRRPEPLEETVEQIKLAGGTALACPGDVTLRSDIEKARILISNEWDRLDILINNAGTAMFKPFLQTTMEEFDQIYRVDLRSVFEVSQLMVPFMLESGGGCIINIASILGVLGSRGSAAYCAMKGGVVNLTRALAHSLGPAIRVHCLCPSHIMTSMMQEEMERVEEAGKMNKLTRMFPLQRVGYPEDVTGSIVFLASDDSKWLTGNVIMVDGGLSCYV